MLTFSSLYIHITDLHSSERVNISLKMGSAMGLKYRHEIEITDTSENLKTLYHILCYFYTLNNSYQKTF